jgi:hypothetical protein
MARFIAKHPSTTKEEGRKQAIHTTKHLKRFKIAFIISILLNIGLIGKLFKVF